MKRKALEDPKKQAEYRQAVQAYLARRAAAPPVQLYPDKPKPPPGKRFFDK